MLRLALLGDPVSHSRSPAIHTAALDAVGIEGVYEARRTSVETLAAAFADLRSGLLDGANVTMPLKRAALELADDASELAGRAGAANTVSVVSGRVHADNTDVGGIGDVWQRRGLPDDAAVLVLGAGGAAAAALLALEGRELVISARDSDRAARLVAGLGVEAAVVEWGRPVPRAVVVNATPLGMGGEQLPAPVLQGAVGLFDMAYGASPTPAIAGAGDLPQADGIDMLVAQAARSFTIWTETVAPFDVMELAARS